jgi:hypothetical protein
MGGLYSALFGENPFSGEILGMINLKRSSFLRYKDAYIKSGEIIVYTKNGGENRKDDAIEGFMEFIKNHEFYLSQKDDSHDTTYVYIKFRVPNNLKERAREIEDEQEEFLSISKRLQEINEPGVIDRMLAEMNPKVAQTMDMLRAITGEPDEARVEHFRLARLDRGR